MAKEEYFTGKGPKGLASRTFFQAVGSFPVKRGSAADAVKALEAGVGTEDEIDAAISRMARGSAERSFLETLMNGLSEEAEIDADGRLVLPQRLREKIGLDDRCFFLAQGDYLKLSTPETHEADLAAIAAAMPALEPGADPLSLLPPPPGAEAAV